MRHTVKVYSYDFYALFMNEKPECKFLWSKKFPFIWMAKLYAWRAMTMPRFGLIFLTARVFSEVE